MTAKISQINGGTAVSAPSGAFIEYETSGGTSGFCAKENLGGLSLIAENSPAGSATSTFTLSANSYRHLRLVLNVRSSAAVTSANITAVFNGDSGSNYKAMYWDQTGSAAVNGTSLNIGAAPGSSVTAGYFYSGTSDLPYPNDTTAFQGLVSNGVLYNGTTLLHIHSGGIWANSAALTSIAISIASGNFDTGSKIALYGVL